MEPVVESTEGGPDDFDALGDLIAWNLACGHQSADLDTLIDAYIEDRLRDEGWKAPTSDTGS
jgi:hypothetical protein